MPSKVASNRFLPIDLRNLIFLLVEIKIKFLVLSSIFFSLCFKKTKCDVINTLLLNYFFKDDYLNITHTNELYL